MKIRPENAERSSSWSRKTRPRFFSCSPVHGIAPELHDRHSIRSEALRCLAAELSHTCALSSHLCFYLSVNASVHLQNLQYLSFMYLYYIRPSIHPSIRRSVYPSTCLSIYPSIHLSINLSMYLPICLGPRQQNSASVQV